MNIEVMRQLQEVYNSAKSGDVNQVIIISSSPSGRRSVRYVLDEEESCYDMLAYAEGELP
jgi:hypothetical protein